MQFVEYVINYRFSKSYNVPSSGMTNGYDKYNTNSLENSWNPFRSYEQINIPSLRNNTNYRWIIALALLSVSS